MTTQELTQLPHVSVDEHDKYVTVIADQGYYIHLATTTTTTDAEGNETEETSHMYLSRVSAPRDCDSLASYDIATAADRLAHEASTDSLTLEEAKQQVLDSITAYDLSDSVNAFILNGSSVWLDKATRVGLMNSTTIARNMGNKTTTLWLGDMKLEVDCDKAIQLLSALEMYALDCFNVTAAHKAAVSELESIEEVLAYDFTANYPSKLEMSV